MMQVCKRTLWVTLFALGLAVPGSAQDPASVWQKLERPVMDAGKSATVENVTLARDRIRITLVSGTLQLTEPAGPGEGMVTGAAFRGQGRIQVQPPDARETQQLRFFIGADTLDAEFTEAAFVFTDNTLAEWTTQVKWGAAGDAKLSDLYLDRQKTREDAGAELVPRVFKSLYSADRRRTALFAADLKISDKGWIHARFDALSPEEITVGRWQDVGIRIFDTWLSFPAGGHTAAEAFSNPVAREDFLIKSYKINASVTGGAELSATTTVTFEPRVAGERALLFELDSNLRTTAVKDAQGASLAFFQPRDPKDRPQSYGDYIAVVLPAPLQAGAPLTLEFAYAGKRVIRQVGTGNYFCQSYGWYPTRPSSFATRADFEINFRTPKKYTLVATGVRQNETVDGDVKISTWKSDLPLAVAGFAFGDYKVVTEKVEDIEIEVYANRTADDFLHEVQMLFESGRTMGAVGELTPASMAPTMAIELANTVKLFQAYFGPYPYKRLALTNIPYSYGQGWPTLIYLSALSFLDSTQRNTLGIRDQVGISDFFRAHESSHQWWGHRVGWKSYHDQWLSEGFAQFSGNLYVQFRQNEKEYLNRIRKDKQDLREPDRFGNVNEKVGPVWMGQRLSSSRAPGAYANVVYNKGGLILHTLRRLMYSPPPAKDPDERFIAMMKDFCQTYHNRAASTEDFKAVAEKYMTTSMDLDGNRKLDWFFRQYVYGTGIPQYSLTYQVQEAGGGKWTLSGIVVQNGVRADWKDALPIYIEHSNGKIARLGVISAVARSTPFSITLPVKPEKVTLNLYEDTLAEIKQ